MQRYIALLRGINVSGKNIIKMIDLQNYFKEINCQNVQTYIQSGNVIFDHTELNSDILILQIEDFLKTKLNVRIPIALRKLEEFETIVLHNPFKNEILQAKDQIYFCLLNTKPDNNLYLKYLENKLENEEYDLFDNNIYVLCRKNNTGVPFSNNLIEKKLKVISTTRNLNTMNKLLELAKSK